MIKQYTRLVVDKSNDSILHVTSQDFPFADGWEPVEFDPATHKAIDCELDTDFVDHDHGVGVEQEMLKARQILENFEIVADKPVLKSTADAGVSAKVLAISDPKDISDTFIKNTMSGLIVAELVKLGSSEKKFLDDIRKDAPKTPGKIKDLSTLKVIRMKAALNI